MEEIIARTISQELRVATQEVSAYAGNYNEPSSVRIGNGRYAHTCTTDATFTSTGSRTS